MSGTSDREVIIGENDFIVSKTDPKGKITYCNRVFIDISGYSESELLHQPHKIIRHPDMPRSVFRLLWQTLQAGDEFFGYVKNRTKSGGYYWVVANVTPSYDADNRLCGYYSVRRCPSRQAVADMGLLYQRMVETEAQHSSANQAMDASTALLTEFVSQSGKNYNELVLSYEK